MLGSKIVFNIQSLQDPGRRHESEVEVSKNSEGKEKDHPGPNIERDSIHTEIQETGRSNFDSDSDSNNNHDDVLDIDEAEREREVDTSRMLSILQKEKSRSRNMSRVKQSRVSAGHKARDSSASSISGEEENVNATRSKVRRSGSIKKRSRDYNDDISPAKSLKSLKVSINRNDARLAKDGPLASLDTRKDPRVRGSKSVRLKYDGAGEKLKSGLFSDNVFKEETPEINDVMITHDRPWKEDNPENQDSDVEFIHSHKCHCGKSFKNKAGLMSHITQAHKDPETVQHHQCKHCELSTTNFGSLQAHILNKHPDKVFKCDKCSKKFTNEDKWIDHECYQKKKTEDVKCPDCDAVLKRGNLNRHKKESCKGTKLSKSKRTLKLYGEALSKVTKEKDPLIDEDNVVIQDVQDDIEAESQQEVNISSQTDNNDPTVREVYFCTKCPKKGLFKKEKEKHEEETGHKLDKVKLPDFLPI